MRSWSTVKRKAVEKRSEDIGMGLEEVGVWLEIRRCWEGTRRGLEGV